MPSIEEKIISQKAVHLERKTKFSKLLILDLDETLVHCVPASEKSDTKITFDLPTGNTSEVGLNIRPWVNNFLRYVSWHFEVAVFTASQKCYADVVLDYLDPHNELVHHRLYRESCIETAGIHVKDLRIFQGWDLSDIILVDNASYSYVNQIDNGVPVLSWTNDPADCELPKIARLLDACLRVDDVREVTRSVFRI